tara:strand:+ start:2151 stop:2570 length:420 start_codon:yes stop_codon:yes gene_type:complete
MKHTKKPKIKNNKTRKKKKGGLNSDRVPAFIKNIHELLMYWQLNEYLNFMINNLMSSNVNILKHYNNDTNIDDAEEYIRNLIVNFRTNPNTLYSSETLNYIRNTYELNNNNINNFDYDRLQRETKRRVIEGIEDIMNDL